MRTYYCDLSVRDVSKKTPNTIFAVTGETRVRGKHQENFWCISSSRNTSYTICAEFASPELILNSWEANVNIKTPHFFPAIYSGVRHRVLKWARFVCLFCFANSFCGGRLPVFMLTGWRAANNHVLCSSGEEGNVVEWRVLWTVCYNAHIACKRIRRLW